MHCVQNRALFLGGLRKLDSLRLKLVAHFTKYIQ